MQDVFMAALTDELDKIADVNFTKLKRLYGEEEARKITNIRFGKTQPSSKGSAVNRIRDWHTVRKQRVWDASPIRKPLFKGRSGFRGSGWMKRNAVPLVVLGTLGGSAIAQLLVQKHEKGKK